jgi:hypothetical protein
MRSLFPRRINVQDIEREVTEQWETMVRAGKNPPPESWTLLGGLHGKQPSADDAAPAPHPTADGADEEEQPTAEPVAQDAAIEEPETPDRPKRARNSSSSSPRSRSRSTAAKPTGTRARATGGGSTGSRNSTAASTRRSRS